MEPQKRLSDAQLKVLVKHRRTAQEFIVDGSVPGLSIRLFPGGAANWTLLVRVVGEGGTNEHGKPLLGKKLRVSLGNYPVITPRPHVHGQIMFSIRRGEELTRSRR